MPSWAGPAIEAGGGKFIARTVAARAYESGHRERTVLVEFNSLEDAIATHDSEGYREALAVLDGGRRTRPAHRCRHLTATVCRR